MMTAVTISFIVCSPPPACYGYFHNATIFPTDAWMRCNTRWVFNPAELANLTEPRLSAMRRQSKSDDVNITTVPLGLYFCFDSSTSRSTLLTFGLGLLHQHVCEQFKTQDFCGGKGIRRGCMNVSGDPFLLVLAWCRGLMREIEEIAGLWYQRDEIYVSAFFLHVYLHFRTKLTEHPSLVGESDAGFEPRFEPQRCGIPTSDGGVYARLADITSRFLGRDSEAAPGVYVRYVPAEKWGTGERAFHRTCR